MSSLSKKAQIGIMGVRLRERASEGVRISFSCCPPSFLQQKTPNGDGLTRRQMGQEGRWRAQITKTAGGEIYVFRLRCAQCCKHFTLRQNFCWSVLKSAFSDFEISQNKLLIANKSQKYDPFDPLHLISSVLVFDALIWLSL